MQLNKLSSALAFMCGCRFIPKVVRVCVFVYTCIGVSVCVCWCVCVHERELVCMCVYTGVCICAFMYLCLILLCCVGACTLCVCSVLHVCEGEHAVCCNVCSGCFLVLMLSSDRLREIPRCSGLSLVNGSISTGDTTVCVCGSVCVCVWVCVY